MREQYKMFDDELLKNDFLNKHKECLPFIGEHYEQTRLLLIAESHYIRKDAMPYVKRDDFYDISFDALADGEYKGWINTRSVFEGRAYNNASFDLFFSNIATEIARVINQSNDLSMEQKRAAMQQYAFFNYFKRPSYKEGKTIEDLSEKDKEYAYNVSCHIINVLEPKLIIFLSKKAYDEFCYSNHKATQPLNYTVKSVSHPSCPWWNRKRKDGKCGRDDYFEYVSAFFNTFCTDECSPHTV